VTGLIFTFVFGVLLLSTIAELMAILALDASSATAADRLTVFWGVALLLLTAVAGPCTLYVKTIATVLMYGRLRRQTTAIRQLSEQAEDPRPPYQ
jgi:hypothetical protein